MLDLNNPAHPGHSNYLISAQGKTAERIWYPDEPLYESTQSALLEELDGHYMERCGFLDADQDLHNVLNSHACPSRNFFMDEEEAQMAMHEIYEIKHSHIIGIYHTHPNGYPWPSPRDLCGWPNPPGLNWRYWLVTRNEVTEWRLVEP